nr:bifunctional diguanylate cyclase/phosphodiesterase [Clostridia bacterium]
GSIGLTTLVALAGVILLSLAITRRITGLSGHVRRMSPSADLRFSHTGIREIDDLTAAVEKLNHSVVNASKTTSKILELTLLPIGGFEVSDESDQVRLSEYLYGLLGLDSGQPVTREQWAAHYEDLTRLPAREHENVYQYRSGNQVKWLRILVAPTETGRAGVVLDVSKDIQEQLRMARALDCDEMTRLLNRIAFKREVSARIERMPQQIGALIYADLDNLKYINDAFGHDMGDRLILRAGEMFGEFERHGGMVCRFSGDEFGVYLHGFACKEEARRLIQAQFARNERYVVNTPDGFVQKIRFSAGLSFYPEDAVSFGELFRLADFAMYEAKNSRKGALVEFSRDSYRQKAYLMENHEALNRLLDEGLIRFAYQPIVDAATGELFAYEALMRPLLKAFRTPSEILAVAAAQSKLSQLERLVLFNAFREIHSQLQALGPTKVFVNTIPSELISEEDFLLLEQRYGAAFGNVCMEITEVENNRPGQMRIKIDRLRRQGIGLAIDDFGSGYSNEIRIWEIAPDYVKVDIALISGIDENDDKQQLVSNLIGFCKPKGIRVVAEGVERREEMAKLVELGVDYMQGYYLGKPSFAFQEPSETARQEILALRRQHALRQREASVDSQSNSKRDVTL